MNQRVHDQIKLETEHALNIWSNDDWSVILTPDDSYDEDDDEYETHFSGELTLTHPHVEGGELKRYFPFRMSTTGMVEFDTHEDSWESLSTLYACLFYNELAKVE